MGLLDVFASLATGVGQNIGKVAQVGLGAYGMWQSKRDAEEMNKYLQHMHEVGGTEEGMVAGLARYFLGGGRARALKLPLFREQFNEVDYQLQEQLRSVQQQARQQMQSVYDHVPPGGRRTRLLAEIARNAQDQKGKATREATTRKRELDIQLTNEYMRWAVGYKRGPGYDAKFKHAIDAMKEKRAAYAALAKAVGGAFAGEAENKPLIENISTIPPWQPTKATPTEPIPAQQQSAIDPYRWGSSKTDWDMYYGGLKE